MGAFPVLRRTPLGALYVVCIPANFGQSVSDDGRDVVPSACPGGSDAPDLAVASFLVLGLDSGRLGWPKIGAGGVGAVTVIYDPGQLQVIGSSGDLGDGLSVGASADESRPGPRRQLVHALIQQASIEELCTPGVAGHQHSTACGGHDVGGDELAPFNFPYSARTSRFTPLDNHFGKL